MRIKNLLNNREYDATLTTEHAASSFGQAVVIVEGDAIDPVGVEIIEINDAEREQLPPQWQAVLR
ncbi:hypothetical protein CKO42_18230 [Lamprobacter modestohalophilus]|uniref:Uncharacterized protein n=1 Tax=Lamprobacter modestohalophilus TaxID=1064514 RepID=A0A9X1B5Y4_9GAMM|nr:hypothetical protein [Lamprobacter modestohalophilus]MBK1620341.1 hypothetical protein [Lamprobacter modestohalophilus]